MARIGLYPALIVVVLGIVAPFFIFKFGRLIGFAPLLFLAFLLGLGYGAVKAEYPWVANGTLGNVAFMAASAFILVRLCRCQLQRRRPYRQDDRVSCCE